MKYNNIIFLGLCLGLTTYSALSADSVIKKRRNTPWRILLKRTKALILSFGCHH